MAALLLMVIGVLLIVGAAATWSIPAAVIVVGVALVAVGLDLSS